MSLVCFHLPAATIGAFVAELNGGYSLFFNDTFCFYQTFFYKCANVTSMWGLLALAVNRFIAVNARGPRQYEIWSSKFVQLTEVFIAWVVGFSVHLYFFINPEGPATVPTIFPLRQCRTLPYKALDVAQTVGIYVPLGFTAGIYVLLTSKLLLLKMRRNRTSQASAAEQSSQNRRILLAKVLCVTATIHSVAFLLYPVTLMIAQGRPITNPVMGLWFRTAFHAGQLSTPITFFIMSRDCRKALKALVAPEGEVSVVYVSGHTNNTGSPNSKGTNSSHVPSSHHH
ncbi:uncharacterized protein LOC129600372 [Paramacrobiotus metropolitanus]|uniref:uncharacterized protein LOC129600372 n=1 Tax=Paramacrobiotus metropolitanus TaxID=2943436 RepID=UPI0024458214|nr:uncharacterized protein LOC129600372 [Paramacrobiotus metropolitanus]